ncbi:diaminopimelate epimerase [Pelagivirga sediminicola]|uniref:Diaminopimelate epimerase n=2 Tax=Pelagivirga sediminicola TaxID=2170575 RepID=A0A2T7G5H3_9RHOB|nr:diaminopimelate epimerase [Pelagivirga sediminicola]
MTPPWSGIFPDDGRPFVKMHGLRNHFIIIDGRAAPYAPSAAQIARICDVQIGVGGDQLLVIEQSARADARLRILNIDGREVGACGNATRCAAWLLMEEAGTDAVTLQTGAGVLACTRAAALEVSVQMGRITHDWEAFPLTRAVDTADLPLVHGPLSRGIASWIGNPHVTFFVRDLPTLDVAALARPVLTDPLFPDQVNVGLAEVLGPALMRLQVYERPGILTGACGTGACVAVRAAQMRGLVDKGPVRVQMGAGAVTVEIGEDGRTLMTGPVAYSFRGRLPRDMERTA